MTDIELIELAKAYVALSNAHQVNLISAMFNPQSVYSSSAVGRFKGSDAIAEMMTSFFARYPDVHWQTKNFQCSNNSVTFDFELNASEAESGIDLKRSGIERIEFNSQGFIINLEVDAS